MSVLYLVLPLAIVIAGVFVWLFIWSVKSGQMDDLDSPAQRIVLDDDYAIATRATRAPSPSSIAPPMEATRGASSPTVHNVLSAQRSRQVDDTSPTHMNDASRRDNDPSDRGHGLNEDDGSGGAREGESSARRGD
jgi:cbb3-type cytochrome oxidase maturation protein